MNPERVETAEEFLDHLRQYASGYVFVHEYAALDVIRARDAAIRAQARAEALKEAAAVAKQSQDDCFCVGAEEPCSCCLEAARIEGYIRGLRDRALAQKAGGE